MNFSALEKEDITTKFIAAHGVEAPPQEELPPGTPWHDGKYIGLYIVGKSNCFYENITFYFDFYSPNFGGLVLGCIEADFCN